MKADHSELRQLQRWMQAVIAHPAGIEAGVASGNAQTDIDVSPQKLEDIVTRSPKLTGAQRLAIYGRAYHARLLECMRAEYPCLLHFLGEELFDRFVIEYLHTYPPQSYTLRQLGARFPDHLAATRPGTEQCPDEENPWPDLVVDLARLERAVFELYDGPGVEGEAVPSTDELHTLPLNLRLTPAVCLRLLEFRFPIRQYFRDLQRLGDAEPPFPKACRVALTRRAFKVCIDELSHEQYLLMRSLVDGSSVGAATERVAAKLGVPADALAVKVREWLVDWAARSYFVASG